MEEKFQNLSVWLSNRGQCQGDDDTSSKINPDIFIQVGSTSEQATAKWWLLVKTDEAQSKKRGSGVWRAVVRRAYISKRWQMEGHSSDVAAGRKPLFSRGERRFVCAEFTFSPLDATKSQKLASTFLGCTRLYLRLFSLALFKHISHKWRHKTKINFTYD